MDHSASSASHAALLVPAPAPTQPGQLTAALLDEDKLEAMQQEVQQLLQAGPRQEAVVELPPRGRVTLTRKASQRASVQVGRQAGSNTCRPDCLYHGLVDPPTDMPHKLACLASARLL